MKTTCDQSNALQYEVWRMFLSARSARGLCGGTSQLQRGAFISTNGFTEDVGYSSREVPPLPDGRGQPSACLCIKEVGESCSECDEELPPACQADSKEAYKDQGLFDGLADLLINVKMHEFIASVSNAYAAVGDHPHQLKARSVADIDDVQNQKAASVFFDYIQSFLDDNNVTIDELPNVFSVSSVNDVRDSFVSIVREQTDKVARESLQEYENAIGNIFGRTHFMREYQRVIADTQYYPHGVMWCDANAWTKKPQWKGGKLGITWDIQSTGRRIDPRYFWTTSDWTLDDEGTGCFMLSKVKRGHLIRMQRAETNGCLLENIASYLETNKTGSHMAGAALFSDETGDATRIDTYDLLVARGSFTREAVEPLVSSIKGYKDEDSLQCEITYAGGLILKVIVLNEALPDMGVYLTVFRERFGVYGIPLYEFIRPFAKFYESLMEIIDQSTEKTIGSIVSLDVGVIEDPEKYLVYNKDTGSYDIDFSGNTVFEFDSSNAIGANNFKGLPLHVTKLPNDLPTLMPLVAMAHEELTRLTGIPSIISSGVPDSSALRTEKLYNAAFDAAGKPLKAILRLSEQRVLEPSIRYFLDNKLIQGDVPENVALLDIEILLSDELRREFNDDQRLWENVQRIASTGLAGKGLVDMINEWGRENGYANDIVPQPDNPVGADAGGSSGGGLEQPAANPTGGV